MKEVSLLKLFTTFFKVNAFTFGGGYTIVPVVKDIFVKDLELIDEDEMMDIVALAQGGPGAMAISTSILTGYKLRGPIGAIVCLIASVLPCLIILSTIAVFYTQFRSNFYINAAFIGISGIISAVLFITVLNMGKLAYKKYPVFSSLVMAIVFILGTYSSIPNAYLILFCAVIGIIVFGLAERRV